VRDYGQSMRILVLAASTLALLVLVLPVRF
jgi:hypothetical protein